MPNVIDVFGFIPNFSILDDCDNITTFQCTDLIPPCKSPLRLEFNSLWNITENYFHLCGANGSWFKGTSTKGRPSVALSWDASYKIVGQGFTPFPKADILSRLATWKFPLIQLISTLPRPPLGGFAQILTVVHLTSDPIGSMEDLLYKLEGCQYRVTHWRLQIQRSHNAAGGAVPDSESKVRAMQLAIIAESYNELSGNVGLATKDALQAGLGLPIAERQSFLNQCSTSAGALAADRATTLFPVFVAEAIFIFVFWFDILRLQSTKDKRLSGTTHDNIEVHSIGFSALFFWLIPSVMIGAIIGTSQTERAIPRILTRFRRDVRRAKVGINVPTLSDDDRDLNKRWFYGMYNWQPSAPIWVGRFTTVWEYRRLERGLNDIGFWRRMVLFAWSFVYIVLPYLIFASAIIIGVLISVYVPPIGFRCRTYGEIWFAVGWIGSYVLSKIITYLPQRATSHLLWLLSRPIACLPAPTWCRWPAWFLRPRWLSQGPRFTIMFIKDSLVTLGVGVWILVTQVGWYNRPKCYMDHGSGLILPEQLDAYEQLQRGLRGSGVYVIILVSGILFQVVVVPAILYVGYASARSTLMQTDDHPLEQSDLDDDPDNQPTPAGQNVTAVPPNPDPDRDSAPTPSTSRSAIDTDGLKNLVNVTTPEVPIEFGAESFELEPLVGSYTRSQSR